ncbi:type VII secretion protein EsaA [Streptococcus gallolyticus subsp. gallolyticus]|uniref:type VII secretion protein EsaA n=1 Tax=Streptococcus gallolyticus TaxID=315405 RepID=UPI0020013601|nr:type VII secretion protein EsaA [Streptococcus gallolyticus]MCQ9215759.1 type VII secretion protein EsaA [Streptococcus gallolyticus]MCY7174473.1 type VII secretion protein EsaA [Streptococcus gallolyticus subsp. gallolyticus]MCY7177035.1 type VII secretion protein EsaA [Streptococcus gallolyticus subsp. gallolyticus]MCY7181499.1 type VII secretion protein EsaA [Streptococcus gallolyticus subsp. gallolyticus]MCY7199143.1 type VII secretion protein EsaA [Streptococcus gallolyticus subsp. gal
MKKLIKYIVSIGAVVLLLVAVVGLNIAIQDNNETTATSSSGTATRLNVAIVNEDKAVVSGNNTYSLGNSYIKKLEKDDSQNWSVVTRGTADSGNYQLIVIIPSDFSAKILDLNSLSAEQATISYEVKADGNQQIETEATKVGKDIVSDLNNQLVDMYMASILSNLYTAQQNVQVIANQQSGNIYSYRTNLLGSAVDFENNFPTLVTTANSSLTANEALIQSLSTFSSLYNTLDSSQQSFSTDLMSLVEKRANDSISYEDFASALMAVDPDALSTDLTTMTELLQDTQSQLETTVSNVSSSSTSGNDDVQNQVDSLTEQINTLENQFAEQLQVLQEQKDNIQQFAAEEVAKYYKDSSDLTVADLLNQKSDGNSYLTTTADSYRSSLQSTTSVALNQLPAIDQSGISSLAANMTYLDASAADSLSDFSTDLAAKFSSEVSYTPSALSSELAAAKTALENAKNDFETEEQTYTNSVTNATNSATTVKAKVSLTLPSRAGFVLDSWSYNGKTYSSSDTENVEVTLSDSSSSDNSFKFTYHYDTDTADTTDDSSVSDSISVKINGVTVTSADTMPDMTDYQTKAQAYRTAESAYTAKVQEVKDVYKNAQTLLNQYYTTDDFLNQSVTDLITDIVTTALTDNLTSYTENSTSTTESINKQIDNLKAKRDTIANQLASLQSSNEAITSSLTSEINAVQSLQEQISDLKTQETSVSSALSDSDSTLGTLSSTLSDLLSSTSELKSTSESNADEASQVSTLFSSFNSDVESAQSNSSKLATDAQDLMAQFNKELEESGDFVGSFVKVLNNAYSNGVANEALLDFLSNPVTESSSSVKATVNVYRPFTWILLLEIVTLFTAYIFATYNVIQKVKDKFSINKLQETDILNTAVIALLAIIIGVILGSVSASRLSVERELMPSWVLVVTLFSLILTQGQYLLIKNFKAFGMGLSLFMTISFVYLSNAIGTTATLSGVPANLKKLNVLSILEETLSSYFDGQSASLLLLLGAIVAILLLIGVNVFVTLNWQKLLQKASKAEV